MRVGPKVGNGRAVAVGPIGRGVAVGPAQAVSNDKTTKPSKNKRIGVLSFHKMHNDYTAPQITPPG